MSSPIDQIQFKRNAVQPVECIKAGWELIRGQYWFFVGIVIVGMLITNALAIVLMGPMMCGIYLVLFRAKRRQAIEFGMLFKGFDYFLNSFIATLIHAIPIVLVLGPVYVAYIIGMFTIMGSSAQQRGGEPDPSVLLGFFGIFAVVWLGIMVILIVLSVLFTFAYPLIVDRGLSGLDAVKLSVKAGLANFWRLLGMLFLTGLLSSLGVLLCFVGMYLIIPISFAAIATAYEQVFGLAPVEENLPPPPPSFA